MPRPRFHPQFGDVLLVPFPFTDQTSVKQRPAVAISSAAYHEQRSDLILLAVTSQGRPPESVGEAAVSRWKEAGLIRPFVLKPLIATIERRLVRRRLGRLTEGDRMALRRVLDEIIGEFARG